MKVTSNFLQIIFVLLFTSCAFSEKKQYEKLNKVDFLLEHHFIDSAQFRLEQFNNDKMQTENIKAFYNLLFTKLLYMQYKTYIPLTPINQSISYYKNGKMNTKLAQALFYKGAILYNMGKHTEGILLIKQSEKLANSLDDLDLEGKIYDLLAIINSDIGDYKTSMFYVQQCMKTIEERKATPFNLVNIYNRIAVAYYDLSLEDSAKYYINKCIPLLSYVPSNAKVIFYDNIGFLNMDTNPKIALKYLNEAIKIGPSPDTYDNLARLYIKFGEKQKADSLWEKALQTKDILKKSKIVEAMLNYKKQEGDYAKVVDLSIKLLALKDSLSAQRQKEQLKELQMDFDNQIEQTQHEKKEEKMKYAILSLFLILVVIALLTSIQHIKTQNALLEKENELLEKQGLLQQYHNYILQMEKNDKADKNEINRLKNKVEKLQRSIDGRSYQGNLLYSIVQQGKSIRNWNKSELQEFLNYYISVDLNYSLSLEEYRNLTARQKVFLILKHEGKSDNKIAEMLGLNNAALRTMKSRIHKIWKEPSE